MPVPTLIRHQPFWVKAIFYRSLTPIFFHSVEKRTLFFGRPRRPSDFGIVDIGPGVIIGDGCIVAANSVGRAGIYPSGHLLAGIPAVIKK